MEQSKAEFLKEMEGVYDRVTVLDELLDAVGKGDEAEMRRIMPLVQLSPGTLRVYKSNLGVDFIREWNMDTTRADIEFGPDWLDREDI